MQSSRRKTALITGASSGIGYELAKLFAADNYDVVLVARTMKDLQRVATELSTVHAIECTVIATDLSKPGACEGIAKQLSSVRIDVLVNNAGFGDTGPFVTSDLKTAQAMIETNIAAVTTLTRLFLPQMLNRNEGKILNVASMASFLPGPNMAVYYATKAYVLSFSQAIAEECANANVTVTALCPGPTKTHFEARAHASNLPSFDPKGLATAEAVAKTGYRALQRGDRVIVHGLRNKLTIFFLRFISRRAQARVVKQLQTAK